MQEDLTIYNLFFKNKLNNGTTAGTYVELGAFDGCMEANTRFLTFASWGRRDC